MLPLLLLVLCACSSPPQAALAPLPPDALILAFGDSLTHGTGAKPEASYPSILQGTIGIEVINAGVPGELTAEGRLRLPRLLDEFEPNLVILCLGGNDMLRGRDRKALFENLDAMITDIQNAGASVILLGVPEPKLLGLKSDPGYAQLAKRRAIAAELEIIPDVLSDRRLKSDPIHPNAKGYAQIAQAVVALLERSGAIGTSRGYAPGNRFSEDSD